MKPSLALVSGWGMPADVMQPLADALADNFNVSVLTLPGFADKELSGCDWETLVSNLNQQLSSITDTTTTGITLAGWSLGAQLCTLYASHYPDKVNHLITLAGNPCFMQRDDWPAAMPADTFDTFVSNANQNINTTLKQFVGLCTKGSSHQRQQTRDIRALLQTNTVSESLAPLLQRLGDDLRPALSDVQCPVTHLLGTDDALVPAAMANSLQQRWPSHDVQTFAGGHTFFLDAPETIATRIGKAVGL